MKYGVKAIMTTFVISLSCSLRCIGGEAAPLLEKYPELKPVVDLSATMKLVTYQATNSIAALAQGGSDMTDATPALPMIVVKNIENMMTRELSAPLPNSLRGLTTEEKDELLHAYGVKISNFLGPVTVTNAGKTTQVMKQLPGFGVEACLDAVVLEPNSTNQNQVLTLLDSGHGDLVRKARSLAVHCVVSSAVVGSYTGASGVQGPNARRCTVVAGIFALPEMRLLARRTFIGEPAASIVKGPGDGPIVFGGTAATGYGNALRQIDGWLQSLTADRKTE